MGSMRKGCPRHSRACQGIGPFCVVCCEIAAAAPSLTMMFQRLAGRDSAGRIQNWGAQRHGWWLMGQQWEPSVGSMHDHTVLGACVLCWIKEGGSCRCNPCPAVRKMEPRRLPAARVDACNPLASPLTITPAKAPLYKSLVVCGL